MSERPPDSASRMQRFCLYCFADVMCEIVGGGCHCHSIMYQGETEGYEFQPKMRVCMCARYLSPCGDMNICLHSHMMGSRHPFTDK